MTHETSEHLKKIILKICRPMMLLGAILFAVSIWLRRDVQLEGLFFRHDHRDHARRGNGLVIQQH
jgi:hypothetical protein